MKSYVFPDPRRRAFAIDYFARGSSDGRRTRSASSPLLTACIAVLLTCPAATGQSPLEDETSRTTSARTADQSAIGDPVARGALGSGSIEPLASVAPPVLPVPAPSAPALRWDWKASVVQTLEFTMFNHAWRVASDPSLRYLLAHKPFYHDWFASYGGYDLKRWSDGDDFVVSWVGHPLQGAVTSRIYLQNNPRSFVSISRSRDYWVPLGQSLIWSALWQAQWKVGPLSETSLGNAGGWMYVPGCGTSRSCLGNPAYAKPPTNNTGLTDWIVSPLVGGAWVIAEDTLERYVVAPVARNHRILGGRILRAMLEPSRDFAALFAGKLVWQLPQPENHYAAAAPPRGLEREPEPPHARWELGTQYTNISLPVIATDCPKLACRASLSATGMNLGYNLTRGFGLDTTVNYIPGQSGSKPMIEGLFGIRFGARWRRVGVFGKVRPGFIHYDSAMPGGGALQPGSLTRFAADFGGIVEFYPARTGAIRLDVGSTLVRYLSDRPDPRMSPIGSLLSNQYIVTQGNFQISTGYSFRF